MGHLVNIRAEGERPLQINAEGFSVLVEHFANEKRENKQALVFHSEDQGNILHVENESWKIDTDTAVKAINQSEISLFELPFYWGDHEEIGRYFINPELVQSIIVSGEFTPESETEKYVALLVDVRGYGRVETYKVPVSVVDELVQTVEDLNPNLMRFDSEQASTRWGPEGYTLIDTTQIRTIHPNGYDMDIRFKDGMRLDFHLDRDRKSNEASNEYLNRLVKRIQGDGTTDDLIKSVGGSLNNLMPRLAKFEMRYRHKLRQDFAEAVAAKAPDLVKIEHASDVYYTTLDQITWLSAHDDSLSIEFQKSVLQRYRDDLNVHFKDEEALQKGLENLTHKINSAKAKPR